MSIGRAGRRPRLLSALSAVVVAASLFVVPVRGAEPVADAPALGPAARGSAPTHDGGQTAGAAACWLEVAASDEVWGIEAVVVPDEPFYVYGEGWTAASELDAILVDAATGSEEYSIVTSDPDGVVGVEMAFNRGFYGAFSFIVTEAACEAAVDLDVLPLADIAESKFLHDIKWLYLERITSGCGADTYCPNGAVTRGQMATFLTRALALPTTATDYFTDDETNKHEANINRLRAAGITFGCSATTFCPDGLVTRGQMASFLSRAFSLPVTATDYFTDDETNKHEANINRLRAAGITSGCGGTRFCPDGTVTRGQMAAFLHRAIE